MKLDTKKWQVQEAKQRFSELLDRALDEGPQVVTRHGKEVAVLVDIEKYRELTGETPKKMDFKQWLISGPRWDTVDEDIIRSSELPRAIDFDE